VSEEPLVLRRRRAEPEAELSHAERDPERGEDDEEHRVLQVQTEGAERDAAGDEEHGRSDVDRAPRRGRALLGAERADADLRARGGEDPDVREEDAGVVVGGVRVGEHARAVEERRDGDRCGGDDVNPARADVSLPPFLGDQREPEHGESHRAGEDVSPESDLE